MDINTEQFKGPLDLLLSMIEDQKLDITEVNLAQITDQYVELIERQRASMNPEEVATFLVIAAKLLLIKSKTLLPYLTKDEEDEEIEDFANQLKIYKDFAEAAKVVEEILMQHKSLFAKEYSRQSLTEQTFFYPPQNISTKLLQRAYQEIITRLRPQEKLREEIISNSVNIDEKISEIKVMLKKLASINFSSLFSKDADKVDMIVNFLATLELMKQKKVSVKQKNLFADMEIVRI